MLNADGHVTISACCEHSTVHTLHAVSFEQSILCLSAPYIWQELLQDLMCYGAQGFPDYFALVGVANMSKSWVRNDSLEDRYVHHAMGSPRTSLSYKF